MLFIFSKNKIQSGSFIKYVTKFMENYKKNRSYLKGLKQHFVCGGSLAIIIIIGIQPLGRFGQRPEFSQATGIALVRCILGKFLGVACHCFPPLFRCSHFSPPDASTSATT